MNGRPLLALALTLVLLAAACGNDTTTESAEPDPPPSTTGATPTTSAPPDARSTTSPEPAPGTVARACQLEPSGPGPAGELDVPVEVVAEGLEVPWGLAVLPAGELLVSERPGRVRLVRDGTVLPDPVLEIGVSMPDPLFGIDAFGFEGGLLGLLLHPDFEQNREFYVFSNVANTDGEDIGRIERYILADDATSATLDTVIIDNLPTGLHHQGGRMHIGPDNMLYVGVGAYEPAAAQNPDSLAGKLVRMDLDGQLPPDNPYPDSYVYASGIRNTQGYDWFDDQHLIVVDHGPSGLELDMPDLRGFDEVNVVRPGDNLGWPEIWGCDQQDGLVTPVLSWADSVPPTGALFYRDDRIPEWTDSFLFTTVGRDSGRHLHRVVFAEDDPYDVVAHEVYFAQEYGRLRTITAAPDGTLYVMTSNCDNRGECPPQGDVILRVG